MKRVLYYISVIALTNTSFLAWGQYDKEDAFRQLYSNWATPNVYRTGSGAPGHGYYQQRADYNIKVRLDDENQSISGEATITYYNNSPDALSYLWLQLDQNMRDKESMTTASKTTKMRNRHSIESIAKSLDPFDGGYTINSMTGASGSKMNYTINNTMMRIDLDQPLKPREKISLNISWSYPINDRIKWGGRSGYEYFEKDDNYLYTIAQFFPRMCVYNDIDGWQNKQFIGSGEFTLPFGDYQVSIDVPADHLVSATGSLENPEEVLKSSMLEKYNKAKTTYDKPLIIATEKEAEAREKKRVKERAVWKFVAKNVRDFAFASSRKFIWDAMAVKQEDGTTVLAMSFYPKEGNPLWEQYSTRVVAHTLKVYSHYTFPYPYPVAQSVHAKSIGMEYPMICFNFGRPDEEGLYSERTKRGMIGVIIHEVGHNYFPMIVNSDERQWTWMDEGLNTFLEYLAEKEWEAEFTPYYGASRYIVNYMRLPKHQQMPIMTNSESVYRLGPNAYTKPRAALNILRETVMGRELFDYAFKEYSRRWMFKHPSPEDFFRTMEDASAVDLDWFWRGWFYSTDHVDIAIDGVKYAQPMPWKPEEKMALLKEEHEYDANRFITHQRNKGVKTVEERDPEAVDFYTTYDQFEVTKEMKEAYEEKWSQLSDKEKTLINKPLHFYEVGFRNIGGIVMPLILKITYKNGESKVVRLPAEIWRRNNNFITKVFIEEQPIAKIELDPFLETADTDESNNLWPPDPFKPSRFEVFKQEKAKRDTQNPMYKAKKKK